jgi:hypothetical protein
MWLRREWGRQEMPSTSAATPAREHLGMEREAATVRHGRSLLSDGR